jgi:hypothetical protein
VQNGAASASEIASEPKPLAYIKPPTGSLVLPLRRSLMPSRTPMRRGALGSVPLFDKTVKEICGLVPIQGIRNQRFRNIDVVGPDEYASVHAVQIDYPGAQRDA